MIWRWDLGCPCCDVPEADFYLSGGFNNTQLYEKVSGYQFDTKTWIGISSMSVERVAHGSAGVPPDDVYVFGGHAGGGNHHLSGQTYHEPDAAWSSIADLLVHRSHMASRSVDGMCYALLGHDQDTATDHDDATEYNPSDDSWSTGSSVASGRQRGQLQGGVVDGVIYCFGGRRANPPFGSIIEDKTDGYNPSADSWSTETDLPSVREFATAMETDSYVYSVGGGTGGLSPIDDHDRYDASGGTWAARTILGHVYRGVGGKASSTEAVHVAGSQGGTTYFDETSLYDEVTDSWSFTPSVPYAEVADAGGARI